MKTFLFISLILLFNLININASSSTFTYLVKINNILLNKSIERKEE